MDFDSIFQIKDIDVDQRLDKWFKRNIKNIPQSLIEKLIRKKKIKVNQKKTTSSYKLKINDTISIFKEKESFKDLLPKKYFYKPSSNDYSALISNIIFENDDFLIINKTSGIAVQSGSKTKKNIIDILKYYSISKYKTPFLIHRIDEETSGVMLIALNIKAAKVLSLNFANREVIKTYYAVSKGSININNGNLINKFEYKKNKNTKVLENITSYEVVSKNNNFSLLKLEPKTGRKHQLRRQLSFIKHPIIGDSKYSIKNLDNSNDKLLLHAYSISFEFNNKKFFYKVNFPGYFLDFCNKNKLSTKQKL